MTTLANNLREKPSDLLLPKPHKNGSGILKEYFTYFTNNGYWWR